MLVAAGSFTPLLCRRGSRACSRKLELASAGSVRWHRRAVSSRAQVSSTQDDSKHVAIVGAGPSGYYVAHYLTKLLPEIKISLFEKLPTPYGLARLGVAPDHPEVKNCTVQFEALSTSPSVTLYSNVTVGDVAKAEPSIPLSSLRDAFDAVVLSYGSDADKRLSLLGSEKRLKNVFTAGEFIGWYNGDTRYTNLPVDLSGQHAIVIGQGNVALDCARILASPPSYLHPTDITSHSMDTLKASNLRSVAIVGRRGPIEAPWTIKELRELSRIENTACMVNPSDLDFSDEEREFVDKARPLKRRIKLLEDIEKKQPQKASAELEGASESRKTCSLQFFLSPAELLEHPNKPGYVGAVRFEEVALQGELATGRTTISTGQTRKMEADLVITSIGRQNGKADTSIPFDEKKNTIQHIEGRVLGLNRFAGEETTDAIHADSGPVYCSGWVKTGPIGTIASTMADANQTALTIAQDLQSRETESDSAEADSSCSATDGVRLKQERRHALFASLDRNPDVLKFEDWKKIEEEERLRGVAAGKVADKIVSLSEMVDTAKRQQ